MSEMTIYQYLDRIVEQPVCIIGRASNMLWIGMGKKIKRLNYRGEEVEGSTYALHIQSDWRIVNYEKKEIMLASSDFYLPKSGEIYGKDFDWDVQGNNLFDEKSQIWLQDRAPIYVREYKINRWGDLLLIFSNNDRLEVFITTSEDEECWRTFKMDEEEKHLVVTGRGVSVEQEVAQIR